MTTNYDLQRNAIRAASSYKTAEPVKAQKFITPVGRASFPSLHEPRNFKGEGPLKYSVGLFLKVDDLLASGLGELVEKLAQDSGFNVPTKRGGKEIPAIWHNPIRFRDEIKKLPTQLEGMDVCLFTAKTGEQYPPRVVGPDGHPYDPALRRGGDFIRVSMQIKPWKTQMGAGIAFYLTGAQLARHATETEQFSSGEDSFERLEGSALSDEW